MAYSHFALLLACLSASHVSALIVGTPVAATARPVAKPAARPWPINMKSQEDKEFEEWARQKKIASGVDPDEDFGSGRRVESLIYTVGGVLLLSRACQSAACLHVRPTTFNHCTCWLSVFPQEQSPSWSQSSLAHGPTTRAT